MTDAIIKKMLNDNKINYKMTSKSFIIPREKKMSDNKAPKWFNDFSKDFVEFKESVNKRFDNLESKVDKNTYMILKAHPEFKK